MRFYVLPGENFADVYGSGTYNHGTYGCDTTTTNCTTTTGGGAAVNGSGGNPLANTGILVSLIVGVAALLLLIVMLVRFWRRPAQPVAAPVTVGEENGTSPDETSDTPQR